MTQPCPRQGCPGIIFSHVHGVKGYTYCSSMCGWLIECRERLIARLEKAETGQYPTQVEFLVRESELLDLVERAFDEYTAQHLRNIPRLWRARRELDWQEQAA